jgi:hypothetical protein
MKPPEASAVVVISATVVVTGLVVSRSSFTVSPLAKPVPVTLMASPDITDDDPSEIDADAAAGAACASPLLVAGLMAIAAIQTSRRIAVRVRLS